MQSKRRQFSAAFKAKVALAAIRGDRTIAPVRAGHAELVPLGLEYLEPCEDGVKL